MPTNVAPLLPHVPIHAFNSSQGVSKRVARICANFIFLSIFSITFLFDFCAIVQLKHFIGNFGWRTSQFGTIISKGRGEWKSLKALTKVASTSTATSIAQHPNMRLYIQVGGGYSSQPQSDSFHWGLVGTSPDLNRYCWVLRSGLTSRWECGPYPIYIVIRYCGIEVGVAWL